MIVSYADTEQGHIGTVYQASNWRYLGEIDSYKIRFGDEILHGRTMNERASGSVPTFASASGSYLWQMLES